MPINMHSSASFVQAHNGLRNASATLNSTSHKFATGEKYAKPSENLFASVEASIGKAQLQYTGSALQTLTRMSAIFATRNSSLEIMRDNVEQLSNIALQAAGTLPNELRSANIGTFDQVMSTIDNLAKNANYGGISLLNGTFGSNDTFEGENKVYNPIAFRDDPTINDPGRISALASHSNVTLKTDQTKLPLINQVLRINGEVFKYVNNATQANEITIASNANDQATNIFIALTNSKSDKLKEFSFALIESDKIKITRLESSNKAIDILQDHLRFEGENHIDPLDKLDGNAAGDSGITFTNYTHNAQLVGQLSVFGVVGVSSGGNIDNHLKVVQDYMDYCGDQLGDNRVPHSTPTSAVMEVNFRIGNEPYRGFIAQENNDPIRMARALYCVKQDDITGSNSLKGRVFKINFAAIDIAYNPNAKTLLNNLNEEAPHISFKQARHMNVDSSAGDIINNNNTVIGTTTGMSAILTSANFDNIQVDSVNITNNVDSRENNIEIKLKDGKGNISTFSKAFAVGQDNKDTQNKGSQVELTNAVNGDTLTLTMGNKDLNLSNDDNRHIITKALQKALGSSAESTFIVGTSVDQTLTVKLNDMSWSRLTEGKALKIDTQANAQESSKILSKVIEKLNAEISLTAAYDTSVDSLTEQLEVSKQNLTASIEELTVIDEAETRKEMDQALKIYMSCISTIIAENKANQLLERLLMV